MVTRRERMREFTKDEIKTIARKQMSAEGTSGISLRGIAREMELTAPALYRYFSSRDDLITDLIVDAFTANGEALAVADASVPRAAYGDRLVAIMTAYRDWALANPVDFQLIYGNAIPGYHAPREVTVPAATRVSLPFATTLAEAYASGNLRPLPEHAHMPSEIENHLRLMVEENGYPVPPVVFMILVHGWTFIHGMIWLEMFGHTPPVIGSAGLFYRHQIVALCRSMNLTVTTP